MSDTFLALLARVRALSDDELRAESARVGRAGNENPDALAPTWDVLVAQEAVRRERDLGVWIHPASKGRRP